MDEDHASTRRNVLYGVIGTGFAAYTRNEPKRVDRDESIDFERLEIDRVPAVSTTETGRFGRGTSDLVGGAPQGLNALVQLNNPSLEPIEVKVQWSFRDKNGVVYMSDTAGIWSVDTGVNTLRIEVASPYLNRLSPGTYELFVVLLKVIERPWWIFSGEYQVIDNETLALELQDPDDAPIVVPPVEDDDTGQAEPLGLSYSPLEQPEPTMAEAIFEMVDLYLRWKGKEGGRVLPDLFGHRALERDFVELIRETAFVTHRFPDDGVDVRWRNRSRRGRQGYVQFHYDRAVVTTRVPDEITVVDSDNADYVLHDDDAGMHHVIWVHTAVDKGIEPNNRTFPRTGPSGINELKLGVEDDEPRQVEVTSTVRLELGPLREKVMEMPDLYEPVGGAIDGFDHVYDYEQWQENPDEAYWMMLGLDHWSSQITVQPIDTDETVGEAIVFETDFEGIPVGEPPEKWEEAPTHDEFEIFEVQSGGAADNERELRMKGGRPFREGGTENRWGSRAVSAEINEPVSKVEWYWKKQNEIDSARGYGDDTTHGPSINFWNEHEDAFCRLALGTRSGEDHPLAVRVYKPDGEKDIYPEKITAGEFDKFEVVFDFDTEEFDVFFDHSQLGTYPFRFPANELHQIVLGVGGWGVNEDSAIDEVRVHSDPETDAG